MRTGKLLEEEFEPSAKSSSMDAYELDLDVCCVKSSKSPLENMKLDAEVWLLVPSGPVKMLVGEEGEWNNCFRVGELAADLDTVI